MKTILQIAFTILMCVAEICGSIICFSNLYKSPFEILMFWCVATIAAILLWVFVMTMLEEL